MKISFSNYCICVTLVFPVVASPEIWLLPCECQPSNPIRLVSTQENLPTDSFVITTSVSFWLPYYKRNLNSIRSYCICKKVMLTGKPLVAVNVSPDWQLQIVWSEMRCQPWNHINVGQDFILRPVADSLVRAYSGCPVWREIPDLLTNNNV
jgi:hypothetical protein